MNQFLTLPFRKQHLELQQQKSGRDFLYEIEGFIYNPSLHGQALHAGTDWYVDYGTEIFSPIDGYAMASYNYSWCYEFSDLKHSSNIVKHGGKKLSYGLGYSVQIYCPINDVFILFGHLSYLASGIKFTPPKLTKDDFGNDSWSCSGFALNKELKEKIDQVPWAKKVRQGDYLGDVGLSGLHIGKEFPSKDEVKEKPWKRIDYSESNFTNSHLHMNIFKRDDNGTKLNPIDPYDLYSTSKDYPVHGKTSGNKLGESHVFIAGKDGLPKFVDELFNE